MAAVAAGAAIVSGITGALGAMAEGDAKAAAARQNAEIAEYNRSVAIRNRGVVLSQATADAKDSQRELTRNLSTIRAAYGANGLALEGSPIDVINDTATEKSYDTTKILYKGDIQAAGYTDEANNYGMKAQLHRQEAESAPKIAMLSAATRFFGGVGSGASAWAKG
jgi:hypothetical protein